MATFPALEGLIPAVLTPFAADGSLHLAAVDKLAEVLVRDGCGGIFVCGTTGEFSSLTVAERMQLAERWAGVLRGSGVRLIVHVGSNCLEDSRALAAHAARIGAAAIAMLSPCYIRPATPAALVAACAAVARAAPELPFYYYDIPTWTHVPFPLSGWVAEALEQVPNFAGVKLTSIDLIELQHLLHAGNERLNVLYGVDEQLLAAWALGAKGAVGSSYNVTLPLARQIVRAASQGDWEMARLRQYRLVQFIAVLQRYGYFAAMKEWLRRQGLDLGTVRLPLLNLSPEQNERLIQELESLGDW